MIDKYELNGCISAPGLAIGGGSKYTFKYGNSVIVKANGYISDVVTTADAPALTTAKKQDGTTPTDLAIDYWRIYTLLASVNILTGAITFSIAVSDDYPEDTVPEMKHVNWGNSGTNDSHKAVVGFVLINTTTNVFTPGSTALDASGVTVRYFDNVVSLLGK
jgi:hypothetical protein